MEESTESAKYDRCYSALSELHGYPVLSQGRRASLTLGACPWLLYFAPSALAPGDHISRLRRWISKQLSWDEQHL